MKLIDIALVALIGAAVWFAARRAWRARKGCGCGCSGCGARCPMRKK